MSMAKITWLGAMLSLSCAMTALAAPPIKDVLLASFKPKGQATLERLDQDATQKACSTAETVSGELAARIIAENTATIRYPADGRYLGDWRNGDKIAQTGTGLQYSDDPAKPAGGNCYACHQLAEAEIAYGTIGPSLKHYGKLRGTSEAVLKYTWAKIYNAQAFMPCSTMPRFGYKNILSEQQIRDVMALLFDPASPVNQ
ncbi:monoheme cytochrome SoxX (sulfur oxidation) [Fontimonas thermophila]|uniref:Monoheme cytochrome SoxX (Sulfur oxidation) n=1 Tax=Fontimonas thermophila TaxID=1076937 RepID=A0A1I2I1E7_9GAMM|nr:sulfur oxidation c-type cytochrome SoxX [Fontimonas thermophila]SFF34897.1 monoheme cytochrome SoxX (sulfur oxidation) [Fontimonas thermophila]